MALDTSCKSTLLTTSKDSAIKLKCNKRDSGSCNAKQRLDLLARERRTSVGSCELEETEKVSRSLLANLFLRGSAQFGNPASGLDDEGWFVALPAMRHRREIRTIGFDEHAVKWHDACGIANVLCLGIGYVASECNYEPEIERGAR